MIARASARRCSPPGAKLSQVEDRDRTADYIIDGRLLRRTRRSTMHMQSAVRSEAQHVDAVPVATPAVRHGKFPPLTGAVTFHDDGPLFLYVIQYTIDLSLRLK